MSKTPRTISGTADTPSIADVDRILRCTNAGTTTITLAVGSLRAGDAFGVEATGGTVTFAEGPGTSDIVGDTTIAGGLGVFVYYVGSGVFRIHGTDNVAASIAAIAALTPAADRLAYFTGASSAALATLTAAGRALLDDADAAAQRTTLGFSDSALGYQFVAEGGDIQAALTAAGAAGGGVVQLGVGEWTVSLAEQVTGYWAAIEVPENVELRGCGTGTIIKLAANQTGGNPAVIRNADLDGGDFNVKVRNLVVDCNGANQGSLTKVDGVMLWRASQSLIEDVVVRNSKSTATFGANEGFAVPVILSNEIDVVRVRCEHTDGTESSGVHFIASANCRASHCVADGAGPAPGFNANGTRGVLWTNCIAIRGSQVGFLNEDSTDVTWVGCIAGGRAYDGEAIGDYGDDEALGNDSFGFAVTSSTAGASTRLRWIGCHARNNAGDAWSIGANTTDWQVVDCSPGLANDNLGFGRGTLAALTSGTSNTAFGVSAGSLIEDGDDNTVFGRIAHAGASVNRSQAFGSLAQVYHNDTSVFGYGTVSTADNQFKLPAVHIEATELASDPAAPAANAGRLYFRDNGSGKTQLVVRFATGAVQVIATEP